MANGKEKDRLKMLLVDNPTLNGIDFVEILNKKQTHLKVHFLNALQLDDVTKEKVSIFGGETIPTVPVTQITWANDQEGKLLLILHVDAPGDFSRYTLKIDSEKLDPFFNKTTFSFKALCESTLDCASPPPVCPPLSNEIPPIDYLAKDFLSFRQALSDFSALRYPEWQERSEADFGVMFMEALCSLADDLSYMQDRIAAEATLDTATQRRSIVRHARLVDYKPQPATSAQVWLQLDVTPSCHFIPFGLVVSAQLPDGTTIDFETGTGMVDPKTGRIKQGTYTVDSRWNRHNGTKSKPDDKGIKPYYWDDSERCLKRGATEMWVENVGNQPFDFPNHQDLPLLIETEGTTKADLLLRELVRLKEAKPDYDPLYKKHLTHLIWREEDALQHDHDLTQTIVVGNLVRATQGRRYTETFAIPREDPFNSRPPSSPPLALVRTGANSTSDRTVPQYLYPLRQAPLVWLAQDDPDLPPWPEIILVQVQEKPSQSRERVWQWRRSLLKADAFEDVPSFTVDPARFSPITRNSDGSTLEDYDGDGGYTIRFGDGTFGEMPTEGAVFRVTYRVGGGAIGNVAADAITRVDSTASALITAVTNPFPAEGGADREPDEQVRRLAPQEFRARQFRAVRAEDYQAAAETLPWVQRAGTTFRWTGSWLTAFTTVDPKGTVELPMDRHRQLIELLNRYRLAGYESYVSKPRYLSLDLKIKVCAKSDAFRGDVQAALLSALSASQSAEGTLGFFHPDNFTFGMPLERSALEAAIQSTYGVAGVASILYRQRGVMRDYDNLPDTVLISDNAILRMDSDPNNPERGSLHITVEGGK